jgi:hypothetical protein
MWLIYCWPLGFCDSQLMVAYVKFPSLLITFFLRLSTFSDEFLLVISSKMDRFYSLIIPSQNNSKCSNQLSFCHMMPMTYSSLFKCNKYISHHNLQRYWLIISWEQGNKQNFTPPTTHSQIDYILHSGVFPCIQQLCHHQYQFTMLFVLSPPKI